MAVLITSSTAAALYCDTDDRAFGPVFESAAEAEEFLVWLEADPRKFTDAALEALKVRWESGTDQVEEAEKAEGMADRRSFEVS